MHRLRRHLRICKFAKDVWCRVRCSQYYQVSFIMLRSELNSTSKACLRHTPTRVSQCSNTADGTNPKTSEYPRWSWGVSASLHWSFSGTHTRATRAVLNVCPQSAPSRAVGASTTQTRCAHHFTELSRCFGGVCVRAGHRSFRAGGATFAVMLSLPIITLCETRYALPWKLQRQRRRQRVYTSR